MMLLINSLKQYAICVYICIECTDNGPNAADECKDTVLAGSPRTLTLKEVKSNIKQHHSSTDCEQAHCPDTDCHSNKQQHICLQ